MAALLLDDLLQNNTCIYDFYGNGTVVWTNETRFEDLDPWHLTMCLRGPQRQPLDITIPITIINLFIFVTGIIGNVAVCVVIIKRPSLQTATNYYLFNLAISDVALLIFGLPFDVSLFWHQYPWTLGEFLCKSRALISESTSYVSVLTIVAFSTERYLAICFPLHLPTMSGLQRAVYIITGLWVAAIIIATPFAVFTQVHRVNITHHNETYEIQESAICAMQDLPEWLPLIEISTFVFFIIPMILILVAYINMGITISRTARMNLGKNFKGSVHRADGRTQSNKSVIRMLAFVVLGFFLCWAPFHAQRLLFIYMKDSVYYQEINYWMYIVTGMFYYFSSTLNPILYNVMSDRMRNAFVEIFCCRTRFQGKRAKKKRRRRRSNQDTYVSILRKSNHAGGPPTTPTTATHHVFLDDEEEPQDLVLFEHQRHTNTIVRLDTTRI